MLILDTILCLKNFIFLLGWRSFLSLYTFTIVSFRVFWPWNCHSRLSGTGHPHPWHCLFLLNTKQRHKCLQKVIFMLSVLLNMLHTSKVMITKMIVQPRTDRMASVWFKLALKWLRRSWIPPDPLFSTFVWLFFAPAPEAPVHTAWTSQPLLTPEPTAWSTSRYAHNKVGKNWSEPAAHPIHHFMSGPQTGATLSAWRQFFTEAAPLGQNPFDWHKPPSAQRFLIMDAFFF